MGEWVLKDEIYAAAHRWPLILVFILTGSLLGWGIASLVPSPYQASTEISVQLNAYRAPDDRYAADYAEAEFRNLDDYKHWQMSQLEILVQSDSYINETLNRLRSLNPAWETVSAPELRAMLEVHWRNAGRWLLSARYSDPGMASQAAQTWKSVIVEKTGVAIQESRAMFGLEMRLRAIANELTPVQQRLEAFPLVQSQVEEWRERLDTPPASHKLEPLERWQLLSMAAKAAGPGTAWQALQEDFPNPGDPLPEYRVWLDILSIAVEADGEALKAQEESLLEEQTKLLNRWDSAIPAGQGLSATLILDPVSGEKPELRQAGSGSQAAIIGGLLGLFAWGVYVVYLITRRYYR